MPKKTSTCIVNERYVVDRDDVLGWPASSPAASRALGHHGVAEGHAGGEQRGGRAGNRTPTWPLPCRPGAMYRQSW